jgi:hypothetical protein
MDTPDEPTPQDRQKVIALLIVYLSALQNGPGLPDGEWAAAEEMKLRLHSELP